MCHGEDGRSPTVTGLSMYPPAPALNAAHVQQYSDAELFWITKNGIRLTGMPGFGKVYSDEQIWDIAHFIRSLGTVRSSSSRSPVASLAARTSSSKK